MGAFDDGVFIAVVYGEVQALIRLAIFGICCAFVQDWFSNRWYYYSRVHITHFNSMPERQKTEESTLSYCSRRVSVAVPPSLRRHEVPVRKASHIPPVHLPTVVWLSESILEVGHLDLHFPKEKVQ